MKHAGFAGWVVVFFVLCAPMVFAGNGEKDSTRTPKIKLVPGPAVDYAPETSLSFGAFSIFTLNFYQDDTTRTSEAFFEWQYTLNKQVVSRLEWHLFFRENRFVLTGLNRFLKFPELFWGVGNEAKNAAEESYEGLRIELYHELQKQVLPNLFAGVAVDFQGLTKIELAEYSSTFSDPNVVGAKGYSMFGAGASLLFDNRKNVLNARGGEWYAGIRNTVFFPVSGEVESFGNFQVDLRTYFAPVKRNDEHILGFQVFGEFNSGQPPFRMLSLLGGPYHMRGYYEGRYRDRHYFTAQTEYRFPLIWRLGLTVFGSVGEVSHDFSDLSLNNLKYAVGSGLRFKLDRKENINARFDFAWTRMGPEFYIAWGEAF